MFFDFSRNCSREQKANKKNPNAQAIPSAGIREYILLGACGVNESLPTNPDLPADVFSSCLTTPILIALKWYIFFSFSLIHLHVYMLLLLSFTKLGFVVKQSYQE